MKKLILLAVVALGLAAVWRKVQTDRAELDLWTEATTADEYVQVRTRSVGRLCHGTRHGLVLDVRRVLSARGRRQCRYRLLGVG